MDLNAWLEEYKNDESLREFFNEKRWAELKGANQSKVEIAKNLLKTDLTLEEIAISTNLPLEEVKKLQKETTEK